MKAKSRQIISALLAACLAIALTACGGGGSVQVEKPTITTPPANQSVVSGNSATFTVIATGSATFTYQWKKNGTEIPGATSSSYTTPATGQADSGTRYSVVVGNSAGSVTSTEASLTVTIQVEKPAITRPPKDLTVIAGATAQFTVEATGTSPLIYQWKRNGIDISGANSSTYTLDATSIADHGTLFSVVVRNSAGTVTSSGAGLTVADALVVPAITAQPVALTVAAGQTASFTVKATGTAALRYQWKKGGSDIPGATASTYTTPATSPADSGTAYSVVVSNDLGTATSDAALLTVTIAPVITRQPAAQTVAAGQAASFSVEASGAGTLTFQWRLNGTDLSGATTSTYTTPATTQADSGTRYSVVVGNSAGTVTSSDAMLTVQEPPAITVQPTAQTITADSTATFTVTATGTSLSYQWKKAGTDIPNATSSSYTTPAMSTGGSGVDYLVEVRNGVGTVTSSNARLTVNQSTATGYSLVASANGGTYDKTECVKENSTGLIWEGKTVNGPRAGGKTFTNYDDPTKAQLSGSNPTQADIGDSANSIGYRKSINDSALCGYTDWRLPTREELKGLLLPGQTPVYDATWFLNSRREQYWTSSLYFWSGMENEITGSAWRVDFSNATENLAARSTFLFVRLVR
ncbi:MAG: immunoglobulin domain-containing protein [Rhodoferax sp.]|nr:immunoglobulin domain-containing protein [Rhodoferax sp.]